MNPDAFRNSDVHADLTLWLSESDVCVSLILSLLLAVNPSDRHRAGFQDRD